MTNGEKIIHDLSKLLGSWEFSFIDAIGRSRGVTSLGGEKVIFPLLTHGHSQQLWGHHYSLWT
jgi:hypothetical protein